jgi:outer membrane protein assembly factor BamD (BamD/ComL family)
LTEAAANSTEFAASYLQIARLLLAYGRTERARRRLKRVVDSYGNTPAAAESLDLLTALESRSTGNLP